MLKPPTPEQADLYDASEEEGDLFFVTDAVHLQCQLMEDELYVHNIEVPEERRRTGVGRGVLAALRRESPGLKIVANGVEWLEPAGRFWKAMVEEGLVDAVVTYQHGEITIDDVEPTAPAP